LPSATGSGSASVTESLLFIPSSTSLAQASTLETPVSVAETHKITTVTDTTPVVIGGVLCALAVVISMVAVLYVRKTRRERPVYSTKLRIRNRSRDSSSDPSPPHDLPTIIQASGPGSQTSGQSCVTVGSDAHAEVCQGTHTAEGSIGGKVWKLPRERRGFRSSNGSPGPTRQVGGDANAKHHDRGAKLPASQQVILQVGEGVPVTKVALANESFRSQVSQQQLENRPELEDSMPDFKLTEAVESKQVLAMLGPGSMARDTSKLIPATLARRTSFQPLKEDHEQDTNPSCLHIDSPSLIPDGKSTDTNGVDDSDIMVACMVSQALREAKQSPQVPRSQHKLQKKTLQRLSSRGKLRYDQPKRQLNRTATEDLERDACNCDSDSNQDTVAALFGAVC
jgi:hypothetical protein